MKTFARGSVDDLYAVVFPQLPKVQYRNEVHFNEVGTKMLTTEVANTILKVLSSAQINPTKGQ